MAAPGTPFETPRACPFVALELDRDKRSDKPDYRHRCFAEPTPAPRSIAHQEAYCLSPNFSACPVFQDWAVRAAAHPVPGSGSSVTSAPASGPAIVGDAAVAAAAAGAAGSPAADQGELDGADEHAHAEPPLAPLAAPDSAVSELPEDASVTAAGAEIAAAAAATTGISPGFASPPTFATTDWQSEADESQQLAAFDSPPTPYEESRESDWHAAAVEHPPASSPRSGSAAQYDAYSSYGQPDSGYPEPPDTPESPVTPAFVPPPAQPSRSEPQRQDAAAAAAVPAFLAGRSARPAAPSSAASGTPPTRPPTRDEIVPSWEIDGRFGAEAPHEPAGGGSRLDGVLTAVAVIAILALGVAAVLFLPGLLNKGSGSHTPAPSVLLPSIRPTAASSGLASVLPSVAPSAVPTAAPTAAPSQGPVASPHLYKIKTGDSLAKIANKFGLTVQQILDANPNITNPNNIFVGQIIVIPPPPAGSPAP